MYMQVGLAIHPCDYLFIYSGDRISKEGSIKPGRVYPRVGSEAERRNTSQYCSRCKWQPTDQRSGGKPFFLGSQLLFNQGFGRTISPHHIHVN